MRILILGGTRFLGRALAHEALQQGAQVSLFHRGLTGPGLFPEAHHILGDRNVDLQGLRGHQFDLVVDVSGQRPSQVLATTRQLCDTGRYCFISTISVYDRSKARTFHEESPVLKDEAADLEVEIPANYGLRKAACEAIVRRQFGERCLILRPCLLIGPHDPTDRFTYWVMRADRGGDILAPGQPSDPVRFLDVRDLSLWILSLARRAAGGTYNAAGPRLHASMGKLLEACNPQGRVIWVPAGFLQDQGVQPWSDLPVWVPGNFHQISRRKAVSAGLRLRPAQESARDILAWRKALDQPLKAGLSCEREREMLTRFQAVQRS